MDTIFVISPQYLNVTYTESKKYSLAIHGYGSFRRACSGLLKTNVLDILGFAFIGNALPESDSEEFECMKKFLRKVNLLQANKKFVFVVLDGITLSNEYLRSLSYVRFFVAQNMQCMSDTVINKNVFGSLLLDKYKPYQRIPDADSFSPNEFTIPTMHVEPLISDYVLQCIKDPYSFSSIDDALKNDEIYNAYFDANNPLMFARYLLLMKKVGAFSEDKSNELNTKFYQMIDTVKSNQLRCIYVSIFEHVWRE